jgi:hypothetical protein
MNGIGPTNYCANMVTGLDATDRIQDGSALRADEAFSADSSILRGGIHG